MVNPRVQPSFRGGAPAHSRTAAGNRAYPTEGFFLLTSPPPRNFRSRGVIDDPPTPSEFPLFFNMDPLENPYYFVLFKVKTTTQLYK